MRCAQGQFGDGLSERRGLVFLGKCLPGTVCTRGSPGAGYPGAGHPDGVSFVTAIVTRPSPAGEVDAEPQPAGDGTVRVAVTKETAAE